MAPDDVYAIAFGVGFVGLTFCCIAAALWWQAREQYAQPKATGRVVAHVTETHEGGDIHYLTVETQAGQPHIQVFVAGGIFYHRHQLSDFPIGTTLTFDPHPKHPNKGYVNRRQMLRTNIRGAAILGSALVLLAGGLLCFA